MSWATSNRRKRLPPNWRTIRAQRLAADNHQCQQEMPDGTLCLAPATDVDHKQAMTDSHRLEDLQSLCRKHHNVKSSREGAQARWANRRRLRRPPEEHPGMIAMPGASPVLPWQVKLEHTWEPEAQSPSAPRS